MINKIVEEYTENSKTGKNLTEGERRGIEKLEARVKSGEIVILMTDKSGKLAVVS